MLGNQFGGDGGLVGDHTSMWGQQPVGSMFKFLPDREAPFGRVRSTRIASAVHIWASVCTEPTPRTGQLSPRLAGPLCQGEDHSARALRHRKNNLQLPDIRKARLRCVRFPRERERKGDVLLPIGSPATAFANRRAWRSPHRIVQGRTERVLCPTHKRPHPPSATLRHGRNDATPLQTFQAPGIPRRARRGWRSYLWPPIDRRAYGSVWPDRVFWKRDD